MGASSEQPKMLADRKRRLLDWLSFKVGWRWGWRRHYIELPDSIWSSDEAKHFMAETMPGRARVFEYDVVGTPFNVRPRPPHVLFQHEADKVSFVLRFSEDIREWERKHRETAVHITSVLRSAGGRRWEDKNEVYHYRAAATYRRTQAGLAE